MSTTPLAIDRVNSFNPLNPEYLEQRTQRIAELTAEIIDEVHLTNLIDLNSGDFTKRICFKTGVLLEQRSIAQLSMAFKVYGEDRAIELLQRENIANCAIHWVNTNSDCLDRLMEIDPYGYAIYAMSYVLSNHSPLAEMMVKYHLVSAPEKRGELYAEYKHREWLWVIDKFQARKTLERLFDKERIVKLNEYLRIHLTLFTTANLPDKFDIYATLLTHDPDVAFDSVLVAAAYSLDAFEDMMNETRWSVLRLLEEKGHISFLQDWDKIAKYQEKFQGYRNFGGQKRPKGMSANASLGAVIAEQMRQAGITELVIRGMENQNLQVHGNKLVNIKEDHVVSRGMPKKFNFLGVKQ